MRSNGILATALAAAFLAGGSAHAEGTRIEKSFELASGASLVVKSEAGEVIVRGVDGDRASVVVTPRQSDFEAKYDVVFEQPTPDRLTVTIERKGRAPFNWNTGSSGARVEVDLPRSVAADLRSSGGGVEVSGLNAKVRANSSGGGVLVSGIAGDVDASSSGGGVEVNDVEGALTAESSGGGVKARNVGGDIDASSSGGGVRIEEAKGAVIADSSGGPVRVGFAAGNAKGGDLSSSGGGVEARLDPTVGLEIDAHSSGGGLDCDLPVTVRGKISKSTLRGQLNGGGALLKLRSSGGGIDIETR